jgi:hypothetical protein
MNDAKRPKGKPKKNLSKFNKDFVATKASIKKLGHGEKKGKAAPRPVSSIKKNAKAASGTYKQSPNGIYLPHKYLDPVPASKLRSGFSKAKDEINGLISEIVETMTKSYTISEIELSASFNADGKFLGIGVGGAATITIRITPE